MRPGGTPLGSEHCRSRGRQARRAPASGLPREAGNLEAEVKPPDSSNPPRAAVPRPQALRAQLRVGPPLQAAEAETQASVPASSTAPQQGRGSDSRVSYFFANYLQYYQAVS